MKNPLKAVLLPFTRRLSDRDWRPFLLFLPLLSIVLYLTLSPYVSPAATSSAAASILESFSSFKSMFQGARFPAGLPPGGGVKPGARIAVCLVGGARRFEVTGPSIIERILKVYENSDLFLHSPLDANAYKLSLLKDAPRIAGVKIFRQQTIPETETQRRVLTAQNSPNGIQGLLQYFSLVEGCLDLIDDHQRRHNFTYDWIVRTRVDTYWSEPLRKENFIPGYYVVPPGSSYFGLNDRLGVGDYRTSAVALRRLSLIPDLDAAGYKLLNSESAFKAQLVVKNVSSATAPLPFCVVTDRQYGFPPGRFGVPVAAMATPGPLSGAKCRPCKPICKGACVEQVMAQVYKGWSWTEWSSNGLQLCNAKGDWEVGWEDRFDEVAGPDFAAQRKRIQSLELDQCVKDFDEMRAKSAHWEAPPALFMCGMHSGTE